MRISYPYTFAEYSAAVRAKSRNRRFARLGEASLWVFIPANLFLGAFTLWAWSVRGSDVLWVTFLTFGAVFTFLAWRFLVLPRYLRWYMRQQVADGAMVELEIDDKRISAKIGMLLTSADWPEVKRVDEEPGHFIVWINKLQAFSIPKAALVAGGFEEQFRAIVGKYSTT